MKLILTYDKMPNKVDPIDDIIKALHGFEVNLSQSKKTLLSTIEFDSPDMSEMSLSEWMDKLTKDLEKIAYVRLTAIIGNAGAGRTDLNKGYHEKIDALAASGAITLNDNIRNS